MVASERLTFICQKWLKDELKRVAAERGVTMSEYIKDTLKSSLSADTLKKPIAENEPEPKAV